MDRRFEILHTGRSPDFVLRGFSLPSFPVIARKAAPIHSDGIVTDSHRIPFSRPQASTCMLQILYNILFPDAPIVATIAVPVNQENLPWRYCHIIAFLITEQVAEQHAVRHLKGNPFRMIGRLYRLWLPRVSSSCVLPII